jgi:hypothetical protein
MLAFRRGAGVQYAAPTFTGRPAQAPPARPILVMDQFRPNEMFKGKNLHEQSLHREFNQTGKILRIYDEDLRLQEFETPKDLVISAVAIEKLTEAMKLLGKSE